MLAATFLAHVVQGSRIGLLQGSAGQLSRALGGGDFTGVVGKGFLKDACRLNDDVFLVTGLWWDPGGLGGLPAGLFFS